MDFLAERLADHRFAELFREELGWDLSSLAVAFKLQDRQLDFKGNAYNIAMPFSAPANSTMVGTQLSFMNCPAAPINRTMLYTDGLSQAF